VILTRSSYERAFRGLSSVHQAIINKAVVRLPEIFGRPHLHAGLGIRPFGSYYECRAGRDLRVLFVVASGDFILVTVGNHNAIARFVRANS